MLGYSNIFQFLIAAVAIIISIVLHELAHGYVALWNGDATAKVNGRLSFNPLKHFDPFGIAMMLLVRFGYAKPVPVDPNNFRNRKLGMLTVAFAGIVMNLLLAFICTPFYLLCVKYGSTAIAAYLGGFFMWMIIVNLNLALFNLLPIYPLDGYRVIESLTRAVNPFNKFMRNYGQYILMILIGISVIVSIAEPYGMPYYFDILGMYINTLRGYIWRGFGWFWRLFIKI